MHRIIGKLAYVDDIKKVKGEFLNENYCTVF